ncbi:gamma-glutamylcyclotransferase family protein [Halomonas sp. B23F22_10]|uniref:gamma-glutamylcyclotransferase family protein n=1 Tax=Halomonas sp. B23F22_10 TaxID=3459515 RepID=UPI00373EB2C7
MERLFIYGTLGPGGPNEHVMQAIGGHWQPGRIKGRLRQAGWGAEMGFPGLVLDEAGDDIPGHVFVSDALPDHWAALDDFEGAEYQRTPVTVRLAAGGTVEAYVYALR